MKRYSVFSLSRSLQSQLIISGLVLTMFSCKTEPKVDFFLIEKQNIGLLTDSTQVNQLNAAFPNDSIVKSIAGDEFTGRVNDIEIYDNTGNKLLALTPSEALDSLATISSVKIIDPRYKTDKGITINSTFTDIKTKHTISSIQNTFNNVVVFVNENNTFYTFDKKDLPAELRLDMSKKIEAKDIPDATKIKYFMVGW